MQQKGLSGTRQRESWRKDRVTFDGAENWSQQTYKQTKKEKQISSGFGPEFLNFQAQFWPKKSRKSAPGRGSTFSEAKWSPKSSDQKIFLKFRKFTCSLFVCNRSELNRCNITWERYILNFENLDFQVDILIFSNLEVAEFRFQNAGLRMFWCENSIDFQI